MSKIAFNFYVKVDVHGERSPRMNFFPPQFEMLTHLGFGDLSKSEYVIPEVEKIKEAIENNTSYSFAGDDWCIVDVAGNTSTISNGFAEFQPFEVPSEFILKLMTDWADFLVKYENGEIPGLA